VGGGAEVSLKECPFCGETSTLSVNSISKFDHSVECSHCGAIGPEEDSAEFAVKAWNEGTPRHHRVHKLEEALKRIRDCDFVITLPDRMDAVRAIAREALQ
jgi:Lar family restriction alleviation protein